MLQANVVDNWDGVYALHFVLPIAGDWELTASINGREVPCAQAGSILAEHGPLTAEDCEVAKVDGRVQCGTSDPIFIQVRLLSSHLLLVSTISSTFALTCSLCA